MTLLKKIQETKSNRKRSVYDCDIISFYGVIDDFHCPRATTITMARAAEANVDRQSDQDGGHCNARKNRAVRDQ